MRFYTILFVLFFGSSSIVLSNNIEISNLSLTGHNDASQYTLVKFDIYWENSWRTSTFESNWDAGWVFVKWRKQGQTTWNHATLNTNGHTAPAGSTIYTPTDGKGIFIHKNANGIGTNSWANVMLQWNYGWDGLVNLDSVEIRVFGIEMVYIPQGPFYLGDGITTLIKGQFEDGTTGNPFQITSANASSAITLGGGGAGSIGNNNGANMEPTGPDDFNDVTSQTLPAAYPKGYNAFYIMKYEVTQEHYVDFLNTLTYTQQARRTIAFPNSPAGCNAFRNLFMTTTLYRNGIDIQISGVNPNTPAVYACNLDDDANYNETNDGQNVAADAMHFADCEAYLDWACLRPMSELEYEKSCRGPLYPVAGEYAWGSTTISSGTSTLLSNGGANNEKSSTIGSNCAYNGALTSGPLRVGSFAQTGTNRQSSGATYYGVMDMSGNVREMAITVGNPTGRSFTGEHGDGLLDTNGEANVTNWPSGFQADVSPAIGGSYRGYDFTEPTISIINLTVSGRNAATYPYILRDRDYGFRGCRTAP